MTDPKPKRVCALCDQEAWGMTEVVHYSDIERGAKRGSLKFLICDEHRKELTGEQR